MATLEMLWKFEEKKGLKICSFQRSMAAEAEATRDARAKVGE